MKFAHIRAHVMHTSEQHINQEIQPEAEACILQVSKLGLEKVTRLRPVPGNLRHRQLGIGQRNTAGVYLIEDVDGVLDIGFDRDRLFRKLTVLDACNCVDIFVVVASTRRL